MSNDCLAIELRPATGSYDCHTIIMPRDHIIPLVDSCVHQVLWSAHGANIKPVHRE